MNAYKTKESLYKTWKRKPQNENLKKEYKNYVEILEKVISKAKTEYEIKKCKKNKKTITPYGIP